MSFTMASFDAWWWPYLFILLAGSIPTNMWRWLGVFAGRALREDTDLLHWVKAVATALIAGVIAKLILFPEGALSETSMMLRLAATAFGMAAFFASRQNILVAVLAAEAVLLSSLLF